jgi:predicted amidophosphoribosyltransferase
MRHAFSPNPKVANSTDFTGTRWIVIDDVFTTGATTNAVAHVLKRLGASEVVVWTVARGT